MGGFSIKFQNIRLINSGDPDDAASDLVLHYFLCHIKIHLSAADFPLLMKWDNKPFQNLGFYDFFFSIKF